MSDKTTWRVLKHDEKAGEVFIGPVWVEVGEIETDYSYGYLKHSELQDLGRLSGPGDYMLITPSRVERLTLRAETVYEIVVEEEAEVVPIGGAA